MENDKKLEGVLLITGGTGSFGQAVVTRLIDSGLSEIRILSRDEKKQEDMRRRYDSRKLKLLLGDVRDPGSLSRAFRGVDFCFHAAALKQVPSCEIQPMEAVRTNVLGTENVIDASVAAGVKRVVCLSTDKAVYPINAMGISKAMMEKVMVAASRNFEPVQTILCGARYGNVMASRGSVIPLFVSQLQAGEPMTLTDPAMTRFMTRLDDTVELALYALLHGSSGDILVQKAPAATLAVLTQAIRELFSRPDHEIRTIGSREGDKMYESLLTREEFATAEDIGAYYRIARDGHGLKSTNQNHEPEGTTGSLDEYTSHNTRQLDVDETRNLLLTLPFIQGVLRGDATAYDA